MNAIIKERWVAALRSGAYKHGRRALRSLTDEFCPLGVLCDLHSKEKTSAESWMLGKWDSFSYCGRRGELPECVSKWAELPGIPKILGKVLWLVNDGTLGEPPKTQIEMATLIEEYL